MKPKKQVTQSASRINTLNKCSWIYHCNYILKLPDEGNDGARRGTVTHNVLECLLPARRAHHVSYILRKGSVKTCLPVWKLVVNNAKILGVDDEENLDLIDGFIMVALKCDFYCEANGKYGEANLLPPEKKFSLTHESPRYKILGFIDKICLYPDVGLIKIFDYKTSKQKFSGEEKSFNVQALLYCVAALQLFPEYTNVICEFQFLKFPRKPVMECEFSREQLSGFEHYLEHLDGYLEDFSLRHATSNYAWDSKKDMWLCGKYRGQLNKAQTAPAFVCRYKYPYEYYVAVTGGGEHVRTSLELDGAFEEWASKNNLTIEKKKYDGCPKFKKKLASRGEGS
jgi:hypothetical protein